MHLNPVNHNGLRYSRLIGTGGIGTGMFFKVEGNHTLGRNESRPGCIVPFRDYCKLHIIAHYVAVLMDAQKEFHVFPIGRVGNDASGTELVRQMKSVGMRENGLKISEDASTLFSVCFQYPDSSGGNITSSNSASGRVTPDDVERFFQDVKETRGNEIILAVPEVPMDTRVRLLEMGRKRGSFNAASLLTSEVNVFGQLNGFGAVDLLAVNIDEARAISEITDKTVGDKHIAEACVEKLIRMQPGIAVTVTLGAHGAYGYCNGRLEYVPPLPAEAVGTGGAGDAFFAGTLCGLSCGLPFLKGVDDETFSQTPVRSAMELGTMLASFSVTSPDTIHQAINAHTLCEYAKQNNVRFCREFEDLFKKERVNGL